MKKLQSCNQVAIVFNVLKIQLLNRLSIYATVPNKDISGSLKPTYAHSQKVTNTIFSKMMDQATLISKNVLLILLQMPLIHLAIVSMLMLLSQDLLV